MSMKRGIMTVLAMGIMAAMVVPGAMALWNNPLGYSTGNIVQPVSGEIACEAGDTISFDVESYRPDLNVSIDELRAFPTGGCSGFPYTITEQRYFFDGDNTTGQWINARVGGVLNQFWMENITEPQDTYYPMFVQTMTFHTNASTPEDTFMYLNWTTWFWSSAVSSQYFAVPYNFAFPTDYSLDVVFDADGYAEVSFPMDKVSSNGALLTEGMIEYSIEPGQNDTGVFTPFFLDEMSITAYELVPLLLDTDGSFIVSELIEYTGSYFSGDFPYDRDQLHPWKTNIEQTSSKGYTITTAAPINQEDGQLYFAWFNAQGDTASQTITVGNKVAHPFPYVEFLILGTVGAVMLVGADKAANSRKDKAAVYILVMIGVIMLALCAYIVIQHTYMTGWPRVF